MPLLENKLTDAVLAQIRSRREKPLATLSNGLIEPSKKVTIREAQLSDFDCVYELNRGLGQGSDSAANWVRLWSENPAVIHAGAPSRIGWLLQAEGRIVGFLGSIPMRYRYAGRGIIAAATCRFAVASEYRGFSHLLVTAFLRQKDVDLFLDTTATPTAAKIMQALKMTTLPQPDYGTVLFWVVDARGFASAVLEKLGLDAGLSRWLSGCGAMAVAAESWIRGRKPTSDASAFRVFESPIEQADPEFDAFCHEQTEKSGRVFGYRDDETMRWHFVSPLSGRKASRLSCYRDDRLLGYCIVRHDAPTPSGTLARSVIADMLVEGNNPSTVQALLAAALTSAKNAGTNVLELMGFPSEIRQVAQTFSPYSRQYPANPFLFKARDRALHEELNHANAWYACPYDGDATLWP